MLVKNGLVYNSVSCSFNRQDINIHNGRFTERSFCLAGDEEVDAVDADGCYVIPGLIDLHFHGCAGYDFCDGTNEALDAITAYQAENGITAAAPASMTLDDERLKKIFMKASEYKGVYKKGHAEIIGINMEGPYISKSRKGAQNELYIRKPEAGHFRRMNEYAKGMIKLTALAPETEDALLFLDEVKEEVRVSVAHTAADYKLAETAFSRGARQVTHLFNAMNPFTHREPGVAGAAFDNQDVSVELICDGIHIMPSMIRAVFKLFGYERVILISDSMMAAGLSDGVYALGGQDVIVNGNKAVLKDGTIAGSVTNLMECMKYAAASGIPLEEAVTAATKNPAMALGAYDMHGSIEAGKYADFVLLDKELRVIGVYIRGEKV